MLDKQEEQPKKGIKHRVIDHNDVKRSHSPLERKKSSKGIESKGKKRV